MSEPGIKELLEAGLHFGHQTRRWDPAHAAVHLRRARRDPHHRPAADRAPARRGPAVRRARWRARAARSSSSGTKKQARDAVKEWAERCGMPYVNQRWLGGLLTNFHTMSARIDRLHELTALRDAGQLDLLPTKERMAREAELAKLEYNLGGVRDMQRLPQAALIIDLKTEVIAVREAERLRIPIIGLVDSNVDPRAGRLSGPGQRRLDPLLRARGPDDRRGRLRGRAGLSQGGGEAPGRGGGAPAARGGGAPAARGRGAGAQGGRGGRAQAAAAAAAAEGGAGGARPRPAGRRSSS